MNAPATTTRSFPDLLIRFALTAVVITLFGLGLRFFLVVHRLSSATPYQPERSSLLNAADTRVTPIEELRARLPFPLPPGARDLNIGEMELSGRPVFRCDYTVSAAPEEVLYFYGQQLLARGYRDETEELIRTALFAQQLAPSGVIDYQNESILRRYDRTMRSEATFSRQSAQIHVAAKPDALPWASQVGVTYMGYASAEELSELLSRTLGIGGNKGPTGEPLTFAQNMGSQRAETVIRTSRLSPADFRADLVEHYRQEGWTELNLPPSPGASETPAVAMIQGPRMLFLQISHDVSHEVSRAVISTLQPR